MCGIYGCIHTDKGGRKRFENLAGYLHDMTVMGVLRGKDSTGMFQVKDNFDIESFKLPYEGSVFLNNDRTRRIIGEADKAIITVGHHRSATLGSITQANAHPFTHFDKDRYVIGVHNGHFNNRQWREDNIDFHVDSDWAFYQIFKYGAAEAIPKLNGAMALVWYEDDGKLRMYSNGERSLYWGYVREQEALIFASEHAMLFAAAFRRGITLEDNLQYPADKEGIYIFDPNSPRDYEVEALKKPTKTFIPVANLTPYTNRHLQRVYGGIVDGEADLEDDIPFGVSNVPKGPQGATLPHRPLTTFQDKPINYKTDAIQTLGLRSNEKVEFTIEKIHGRARDVHHIVGQILTPNGDVLWALFPQVSDAIKENMEGVRGDDTETTIFGYVMGVTELYVDAKPEKCAVLTSPSIVTGTRDAIAFLDAAPMSHYADDDEADVEVLDIPGPKGNKISEKDFGYLARGGCGHCGGNISAQEARNGQVDWIGDTFPTPVHAECALQMMYSAENGGHETIKHA